MWVLFAVHTGMNHADSMHSPHHVVHKDVSSSSSSSHGFTLVSSSPHQGGDHAEPPPAHGIQAGGVPQPQRSALPHNTGLFH